jgi:hypothetical protein
MEVDFSGMVVHGDVDNSGGISLQYGGTTTIDGTLRNTGGFDLSDRLVANIGAIINGGQLHLQGGPGIVTGSLVNTGTVSMTHDSTSFEVLGDARNSGQILLEVSPMGGGGQLNIHGTLTNDPGGVLSLEDARANIGSVMNRGTVYIAGGSTLNVTGGAASARPTGTRDGYVQTGGQTTVDGNLNITGRGVVNFAGGSVYGNGGTVTGPVISNAAIKMGDTPTTMGIGQLTFVGNYIQGPLGSLTIDIAGFDQYDQLNITGHAQLNGLLNIDLLHGYVPQLGDTFDIMNFANESGTFSLVMGLPINGQEHFTLEYNPTNLTLDVVAGPLLSPDSGKEGLPATVPFIVEPDNDGTTLIASNIASGSAPHYGLSPTTPEPGTLLLLVSGLLCVGYSVRRRMTK